MQNDAYTTTRNNSALWWMLGGIAVLAILWAAFHAGGPDIPNTGVDDANNSALTDTNSDMNGTSNYGSPAIVDEAKG